MIPALVLYCFCVAFLILSDSSAALLPDKFPHLITLMGLISFGVAYLLKRCSQRPLITFACLCGQFLVQEALIGTLWKAPVARSETMLFCGLLGGLLFSTIMLFLASRSLGLVMIGVSIAGFIGGGIWLGTPWIVQSFWLVGPAMGVYAALSFCLARQLRSRKPQLRLHDHGISQTEFFCIQRLLAGMDTKEIAGEREVSVSAINNHLCGIYAKLGVKDRAQLLYNLGRHEIVYEPSRG
jgi:DNA-binding CsgD family transcriptional regulator